MSNEPSNQEQGFTLVELLIAIAVSGLIISALVAGFIATMRGTASAHDRFVASNGNHSVATYFTSDVQSANATTVSTDPAADSSCSTTEAGTNNVVRLQWFEKPTLTKLTAFSVSYRTRKVGSDWQLVRYACSGSQDPSTTPTAILSAAVPTSQVMVSRLYDPTATPPYPTVATISGRVVNLSVFSAIARDETAPYNYTVSANLRSLSGGTTTTTTSTSTTSTSTSTSSTTTSSTTTTTTTAPTPTKLGLVSCVKSDGTTVNCAGPITLTTGQWVDISVQLQSASGTAVNSTSNRTVNVASTPTNSSNKFTVTAAPVTIATGTSQSSGPFRVTRSENGGTTVTVTASSTGLTSASVDMS